MSWLATNLEWLFSGIGVFAIGLIVALFKRRKSRALQQQVSGPNSTNYQAGRDLNVGRERDQG